MHANEQLIRDFYTSFQKLDHDGMMRCYDEDIRFSDPVFPYLKREEPGAMWHMLITSLKKGESKWNLTFSEIVVNDVEGSCGWEAQYNFSMTRRRVHNKVFSKFQFRGGKIVEHSDYFDFYKWTRMAFGFRGMLLGWTDFFHNRVQRTLDRRLKKWMEQNQLHKTT
jgi:ketosteroid isomerase-like protein